MDEVFLHNLCDYYVICTEQNNWRKKKKKSEGRKKRWKKERKRKNNFIYALHFFCLINNLHLFKKNKFLCVMSEQDVCRPWTWRPRYCIICICIFIHMHINICLCNLTCLTLSFIGVCFKPFIASEGLRQTWHAATSTFKTRLYFLSVGP